MNENSKTPRGLAGASERLAAGGGVGLDAIVPQPLPPAQQQGLFPASSADDGLPIVRPLALATRGRVEFTGRCPNCDSWHRHVHLGAVRAPCGAQYRLEPRRGRRGRAA